MPVHLPDAHKYHPALEEQVIAVVRHHDHQKGCDYLDLTSGINEGIDSTYWKDGYKIRDRSGQEVLCCPGLLYPRTLTASEVWSHIAKRLAAYVFLTPTNRRSEPDAEADEDERRVHVSSQAYKMELSEKVVKIEDQENKEEHCAMCADRRKYWAVSPPHFLPRRQFGLKPTETVDFV
ncbi:hypothetical protein E4T56_gene8650 [Termitomyces sp. T112]|nr:hypothetical protein E4T56_gene8650 [Termitomyces sp. T112]KNZ75804.1 hypothetical protein J132_01551 [Termitomyces sp. J132]